MLSKKIKANGLTRTKLPEIKKKPSISAPEQFLLPEFEHNINADLPMDPPVLRREQPSDYNQISPPEQTFENCLFISDTSISSNILDMLTEFKSIKPYCRKTFTNRDCATLRTMGIDHIWANIKDAHARHWISENLKKNQQTTSYTVIVSYGGDKLQKWIEDLKPFTKFVVKLKDLKQLKAINFNDLDQQLLNFVKVHKPVSKLLSCLGIKTNTLGKKKA